MKTIFVRGMMLAAAPGALLAASAAHAGAFYLQEQSVRATGRAFSGEVADQGSASLWWNPAAIGGMTGGEGSFGLSAILPKGKVTNLNTLIKRPTNTAPVAIGGEQVSEDPINKGYLPSGAVAYGITPKVALGLAITSPYSFTTNYNSTSWARYTADKTMLRTFDIQPSVAFAPNENISLGVALNAEHSKASLSNFLPNLSAALPDGHQTLKGDGWDFGWTAGAQFRTDRVTFGASYKSSVKHVLKGDVVTAGLLGPLAGQNGTISTKATFRTPWQATFGARFKATDKLTLNAQIVRFGWNKFDSIRLGSPINSALPENYKNTWSFAGGVDYAVNEKWTLRGGIQHDQTPTRDGNRDARVPDGDRWNFALGTSYDLMPGFTIDAAANYLPVKNASIDRTTAAYAGTAVQTPILVNGELRKASVLVFALGGRLRF
ncbi:OmpP1/FadL family transporter [Sphingomonas sp.]|uniref:OmpP1/FadL family transporter n=1 Tax=Sphingomonas sp. TaxID=28214 RepID=UPI000DB554E7|nr:outer membrane protein transport protein [Sphingomonas sp.]PZU08724.1 MAG: aromatic hydrocarbon degradation protein [Sphingomonas sp.]